MRSCRLSGTLLLVHVAATACGTNDVDENVLRVDSAGMEVVTSSGVDVPLDWTLHRQFSLGGAEGGQETFDVVTPSTIATDAAGRLYVLDIRSHRVVTFDRDGNFAREFGREGQGPGELAAPNSIAVSPDGTVSVFDFGKAALVRFDSMGGVLEQHPTSMYPVVLQPRHMLGTRDGTLFAALIDPVDENTFRYALRLVTPLDTVLIAAQTIPRPSMVRYASCGGGLNLPRIFESGLAWVAWDDQISVSSSPAYSFEVHRATPRRRIVRRDVATRTATRDMALAELGEGFTINFGRGPCVIPPQEMVDGRGFAPELAWIAEIAIAPDGETWVLRKVVGSDSSGPIDIFDETGAYVGTLPEGGPFPILFLGQDRFAAREKDELDITRVVVFEVDRS